MEGAAVSEHDRRLMRRQGAALSARENWDENPAFEAAVTNWANKLRAARGIPPLRDWWATKTEGELHRRARTLGLLD